MEPVHPLSVCLAFPPTVSGACDYVYVRQPPSSLPCTPRHQLVLECEAHSTTSLHQHQAFQLLWYAVTADAGEPVLLSEHSGVRIEVKGTSQLVASTLVVPPAARRNMLRLFCQIQAQDGTLLQPSQVMTLPSSIHATSDLCTSSLVDRTYSCAARESADKAPPRAPPFHLAGKRAADKALPSATPTDSVPQLPVAPQSPVALYAVVATIALFVAVILSLTIVVVLLYRKKCGHVEVSSHMGEPAGKPGPFCLFHETLPTVGQEGAGPNAYDGFDADRYSFV